MSESILFHLIELRKRVVKISFVFALFFVLFFLKANTLFNLAISPLIKVLPKESAIIATHVASPLVAPIHLALDMALLVSAPYALYQLWQFISPGLYRQEKNAFKGFLWGGVFLFISGIGFCFFVVLPFIFTFFVQSMPKGIQYFPDMTHAIGFISQMMMIFGLMFQLPICCVLSVRIGWVTVGGLQTLRPYFIVTAFIIGMLLTPPDVISQLLLALPMCVLYEVGIWFSKNQWQGFKIGRRHKKQI